MLKLQFDCYRKLVIATILDRIFGKNKSTKKIEPPPPPIYKAVFCFLWLKNMPCLPELSPAYSQTPQCPKKIKLAMQTQPCIRGGWGGSCGNLQGQWWSDGFNSAITLLDSAKLSFCQNILTKIVAATSQHDQWPVKGSGLCNYTKFLVHTACSKRLWCFLMQLHTNT